MSAATKEKAAWVFVPPKAAQQNAHSEFTPDQKRLATIIAKMTLAGHQVHRLEHGFLVTRWGMSRHCPDLGSLAGFARQVGVKA